MSAVLSSPPVSAWKTIRPSDLRRDLAEDDSPFGLQGLVRGSLTIVRSECIGQLAATLALSGTPDQIRDRSFVDQVLAQRHDWRAEYEIVHLIERSLWINGHSDLVMTLLRNPSQIPDNPPREIIDVMSQAIDVHPDATIWYGVPLFSDRTNDEGLPIPLTAPEVRVEAEHRIATAQQHALRWRLAYRAAHRLMQLPYAAWRCQRACRRRMRETVDGLRTYWKRAQRDQRNRNRAAMLAHSEFCRLGRCETIVPEHTTSLGRVNERACETIRYLNDVLAGQASNLDAFAPYATGAVPVVFQGMVLTGLAPLMIAPMTIITCDPFLFVELPEETGKLRFLGHWYWQGETHGRQKLHLHV